MKTIPLCNAAERIPDGASQMTFGTGLAQDGVDLAHGFRVARPRVAILATFATVESGRPGTWYAVAPCKMADRGRTEGVVLAA